VKRLTIAAALLLAATSMPVWAQAPAAGDPKNVPQTAAPAQPAMPKTNCPGIGGASAEGHQGCPMLPGDVKSEQGGMSVEEMKHGMMHGQMRHAGSHSDHGNCCELSKADKPK
jgi:hypothetical protein